MRYGTVLYTPACRREVRDTKLARRGPACMLRSADEHCVFLAARDGRLARRGSPPLFSEAWNSAFLILPHALSDGATCLESGPGPPSPAAKPRSSVVASRALSCQCPP